MVDPQRKSVFHQLALCLLAIVNLWKSVDCAVVVNMKSIVPTIENKNGFDKFLSGFFDKNDKIALLLDFDGTLSPITTHPNFAVMEPESEKILYKLATHPNVFLAIISGRGPLDVQSKVGIENITYAGNHGLEIFYANGNKYHHELSDEIKENFSKLVTALEEKAKDGAWLENKVASLTFHYREVPEEKIPKLVSELKELIENYGFIANQAHFAIEAKPPVKWNKGEAALLILTQEFGDDWHKHVKTVFAGDDTTDEDAMKALKGKAVSFRVSTQPDIPTFADYRLPTTKTMSLFLEWIEQLLY